MTHFTVTVGLSSTKRVFTEGEARIVLKKTNMYAIFVGDKQFGCAHPKDKWKIQAFGTDAWKLTHNGTLVKDLSLRDQLQFLVEKHGWCLIPGRQGWKFSGGIPGQQILAAYPSELRQFLNIKGLCKKRRMEEIFLVQVYQSGAPVCRGCCHAPQHTTVFGCRITRRLFSS